MSQHHTDTDTFRKDARTYTIVLAVLLTLTVVTVTAAGIRFESGMVNVVIALGIATVKASLVALFFMHLLHDKPFNAIALVAGFLFLGLFLGLTYADVGTRALVRPSITRPATAGAPALPVPGSVAAER